MTSVADSFEFTQSAAAAADADFERHVEDALHAYSDLHIASSEQRDDRITLLDHLGTVAVHDVAMSDGSLYTYHVFNPHDRRYEIPVSSTTAWFTSAKFGHNFETAELLMARGMASVVVSQQHAGYQDALRLTTIAQIPRDIHAQHVILDKVADDGVIDTEQAVQIGFSKGGMVGFGAHAVASQHGRTIPFFEYRDPCLEHKLEGPERRITNIGAYVVREGVNSFLTIAQEIRLRQIGTVFKTMVGELPANVAAGFSIFSIAAGEFAKKLPEESVGHVSFFEDSALNHRVKWHLILDKYPYISHDDVAGFHLHGMSPDHWEPSIERITFAQQLLLEGKDLRDFKWDVVPQQAA